MGVGSKKIPDLSVLFVCAVCLCCLSVLFCLDSPCAKFCVLRNLCLCYCELLSVVITIFVVFLSVHLEGIALLTGCWVSF